MERYNIVLGIVSNDNAPLAELQQWVDQGRTRIWASAYFEGTPGSPLPNLDELRREYRAGRLKAMGEIGAQYGGIALNDRQLEPYFALAEELDIPVGVHTGGGPPGTPFGCCPRFRMSLGNPLLLEDVLVRHPKLRIFLMHAGWPYRAETIALMYQYPQVYADLSAINWALPREEFHAYLRELMRAGMGERLMFGSDQVLWPETIGTAVEAVETATFLSEEQKQDIFCRNAARFLRLNPDPCGS
jgi:predicted TIM-barrel fold metal-dependent hydrolase